MSFVTTCKIDIKVLYRGIYEFKKDYHPRTNLVKDETVDLVDSHNILNRRKNYFCQLLNVLGVNDVRRMCMQLSH
jgi:hypothetical protein